MALRKKRRKSPRAKTIRPRLWLCLLVLALAIGFVGGYWYGERSRRPSEPGAGSSALAEVESVLGPLGRVNRVEVTDRQAAETLLRRLESIARRRNARVNLSNVSRSRGSLRATLTIDSTVYPFQLQWHPVPEVAPPRLAVVIDDLGQDLEGARAFLDLEVPITPSILPRLPASEAVARLAHKRGRECLLHLPMEPRDYPEIDPGPGALFESMDGTEVRRVIAKNLEGVPGAAGTNNHMGSRLTEIETSMGWVMDELKARGLYFLDSVTSGQSVAIHAAREAGVAWARRDVFLDNVRESEAIGQQIEKAIERAKRAGQAVAIGHPHRVTLTTLRAWIPKIRAAGVKVVPLGNLVHRGNGA
jgi:polysaccharide deacetylase 2 family uncharacterized protein YibQ